MANLASSAVTVVRQWNTGGQARKERVEKLVRLALTGQGGVTNLIGASALGLTKIEECSNAIKDDNSKGWPAVPLYGGAAVALLEESGYSSTELVPTDVTATVELTVKGY